MAYKLYKGNTLIKKIFAPLNLGFTVSSNYYKVGSPTISNNVASGFSTSNYLTLNRPITIGNSDYEIIIKFKAGSQNPNSSYQAMYYQGNSILSFCLSNKNTGFQLHSNTGNGTEWNSALNGTTEIPVGKIGWAKFVRKNGVRSQYLSYDGINWTNEGSIADTNDIAGGNGCIGIDTYNFTQNNTGSIYLAESTFNINGAANIKKVYKGSQLVWQGDPYEPGTDVFYKTGPATFETILGEGVYDLIIAGGGGEGRNWNFGGVIFHNAGGSGAAWEGSFYNPKEQSCKIYAGAVEQDSYLELGGVRMITAGKGNKGADDRAGGIITVNSSLQIVEQRKKSNGNTGAKGATGTAPTASVCSINNWGQGSWGYADDNPNWIAGGAKFQYLRLDK